MSFLLFICMLSARWVSLYCYLAAFTLLLLFISKAKCFCASGFDRGPFISQGILFCLQECQDFRWEHKLRKKRMILPCDCGLMWKNHCSCRCSEGNLVHCCGVARVFWVVVRWSLTGLSLKSPPLMFFKDQIHKYTFIHVSIMKCTEKSLFLSLEFLKVNFQSV